MLVFGVATRELIRARGNVLAAMCADARNAAGGEEAFKVLYGLSPTADLSLMATLADCMGYSICLRS
jgi:hypothetical protein